MIFAHGQGRWPTVTEPSSLVLPLARFSLVMYLPLVKFRNAREMEAWDLQPQAWVNASRRRKVGRTLCSEHEV